MEHVNICHQFTSTCRKFTSKYRHKSNPNDPYALLRVMPPANSMLSGERRRAGGEMLREARASSRRHATRRPLVERPPVRPGCVLLFSHGEDTLRQSSKRPVYLARTNGQSKRPAAGLSVRIRFRQYQRKTSV